MNIIIHKDMSNSRKLGIRVLHTKKVFAMQKALMMIRAESNVQSESHENEASDDA